MAETINEGSTQASYLGMSDDELMNLDPSTVGQDQPVAAVEVEDTGEATAQPVADADTPETVPVPEVTDAQEDTADAVAEPQGTVTEKVEEEVPSEAPDYKAMYEKITAPFKANGRDIAVKNAEDAISLMQMGANYNKKMAALKPNLKLMKLLENNGLLNEERIGFLIDLEKKNPNAINKLIKDSGLDPMDLNTDTASEYKPNTYTVDDREMELDAVLEEIQGTPTYNRTLEIVGSKWDGPSKQVIAGSPQLLKVINDHVQSGIYDTIIKEVERERMFGRLNGLSDIDAYKQTGDAIQSRGGFAPLVQKAQQTPAPAVVVVPKLSKAEDDKLNEKRRAAGSTKPASAAKTNQDYNPLSLSDDAFSKLVHNEYI